MRLAWQIVLAVGVIGGVTFVATYAWWARHTWWRSAMGRHLMALRVCLTAVLMVLWWHIAIARVPTTLWLICVALISAVIWGQNLMLYRVQRETRKNKNRDTGG